MSRWHKKYDVEVLINTDIASPLHSASLSGANVID